MATPFQKLKPVSPLTTTLNLKKNIPSTSNFKVSFQYLDTTQKYGSSFKDWQSHGLLSKALEVLQGYCCSPLRPQLNTEKFTSYGDFPNSNFTLFNFPANIPEDASWARIHITGPAIVVGHIVENTFYVVFLDKTHKFFLTKNAREQLLGKKANRPQNK